MTAVSWQLPLAALALAPLLAGIINRVKAIVAGRRGVPVLQLYYDLYKLFRKGTVLSRTTTWVTRIAPAVVLASIALALTMVPWGSVPAPVSFAGDIVLLAYLLGLSRFMIVIGALDTGSSFEGMGASREVQFGTLTEPSIFLGMLVLALHSGQIGMSEIFAGIDRGIGLFGLAPLLMVAYSWGVALLTENSRIPVDDPNTHLELTMIHEVMVLDSSGPDFGFMLYAASLKLWLFSALIVNLFMPHSFSSPWLQLPAFLLSQCSIAIIVGVIESSMARLRLRRIPKLLVSSGALGAIALILMVLGHSI